MLRAKAYLVFAVYQDASGRAMDIALAYAAVSAVPEQVFWKPRSVKKPKPTYLVNKLFFAAA